MRFSDEILKKNMIAKEDEVNYMCENLIKIIGKTPEELLRLTEQEDSIPVDISTILFKLNISEIKMDFAEIEKALELQVNEKGAVSGMVLLSGDNVGIFYNEKDGLNRQRFTIAHELAHCCLNGGRLAENHIEFRHEISTDDEEEIAANTFAGKLLIPEGSLKKVYEQLSIPVLDSLAKIFQVSITVMKERLKMLKMDYFDTELNKMVIFGEE